MQESMQAVAHIAGQNTASGWFEVGEARIYYEVAGTGDPVLLLPGWGGTIEEFTTMRAALVAANYQVIAADLPGSGRSEPQPRVYSDSYFAEDAHAFAALLAHLGVMPAHLLGFSDGGEVALLMAAQSPQRVRSVAAWGAAGQLNDPDGHMRAAMMQMMDGGIPAMEPFREYLVAMYGEENARAMVRNFVAALTAMIEAGGDISLSQAGSIRCPVFLIAGEHDPFAPRHLVDEIAAQIPNAEVVTVADAGHNLYDTHGGWLIETLLAWLQRQ